MVASRQSDSPSDPQTCFRAILDRLPFPAWLKDTESRFLAVNEAFVLTFGLGGAEALVGKDDFAIAPRELAEAYRAVDREVISRHQKMVVEEEICTHGQRLWFETYKAPFFDTNGELLGSIGFARDVSERKQVEAQREKDRERLELALAGGDLGMWDWHIPSGRVLFNERWASMLGESPERLAPHIDSWRSRLHPADRARTKAAWIAHLRRQTPAYESEHRVRHRDGHWIWILDHGKVLEWDAAGRPLRAVGTHLDISVRKENERRLRESEERWRLIHEHTGEAIIFAWPDGRIDTANPAACKLFGLSEEEFRRRGRAGIVDMDDPRLRDGLVERLRTRQARGELTCIHGSGRRFPAEVISTLFVDSKGELRSINQFRDITARKCQESQQEESRQRLELALAGADLGMWDWHLPSGQVSVDARWAAMLGERAEPVVTRADAWEGRLHPDDVDPLQRELKQQLASDAGVFENEYRLRHRTGHWVWILSRGKVIERDGARRPLRVVGTHLDITRRKEAERLLHDQLHLLRLRDNALSAISQGVLITDAAQRITYANSAFETITGYTLAEIRGRECNFLQGPDSDPTSRAAIRAALQTRQPFHGELLNYRKDGTPFWNELSITPVFDDEGQASQFVAVLRDVTARKRDEDVLRDQAGRIESLSRHLLATQEEMRRRLAADLHDRTSPNLAAISINLGLLSEALCSSGDDEITARLEDTRALIEDTVASIRDISAELRSSLLDYAGLLPAMESYAQHFRRRTGIVVRIDVAAPPSVLAAELESALFRIFQEALTNVAKHAHATTVVVGMVQDRCGLSLSISDDGSGFDVGRLGEPSFESGLGLVNMREMAEFSGGSFALESAAGSGTRIFGRIPAAAFA
ncbi:PAS domain S-box protein [Azonexus caeni]|jgi:PAS domain S-box-containing protein|uniref:PAS domain S-box protein n=1 Tax=Azonexus caeni TaxID=266126 RepID=UPI003A896C61